MDFKIANKKENLGIISDTISASISLAGFILASLTVIASMRSNITNKSPDATRNPLEMFFSDKNYSRIVQVFKDSIIELILVFVLSYLIWISQENFENYTLLKWIVSAIIIVFLSISRTLLVLFTIIKIDRT
jgi:glycerol uptake facilitator-like aquaporin